MESWGTEEVKKKEHFDDNFVCDECRSKDE